MKSKMAFLCLWIVIGGMLTVLMGCPPAVVRVGPPPPPVETYGVPPYPGAAWIPGYWQHRGGEWFWVPGHWERAPRPNAAWIPGHWVERPGGWIWIKGHWEYR